MLSPLRAKRLTANTMLNICSGILKAYPYIYEMLNQINCLKSIMISATSVLADPCYIHQPVFCLHFRLTQKDSQFAIQIIPHIVISFPWMENALL